MVRTTTHPRNDPLLERTILDIEKAQRSLDRLLDSHPEDCGCGLCDQSHGLVFMLDTVHDLVENEAIPFNRPGERCYAHN